MEYATECFCWKNNKQYKRLGKLPGSRCNVPCEGDVTKTCGGKEAIEVFKIKNLDFDKNVNLPK